MGAAVEVVLDRERKARRVRLEHRAVVPRLPAVWFMPQHGDASPNHVGTGNKIRESDISAWGRLRDPLEKKTKTSQKKKTKDMLGG